ncbi:MAG: hypothetical protein LBJ14_00050 [Desulfarculales bacterium]|nr:hypothetical protein [Desulfarculales bacterium]
MMRTLAVFIIIMILNTPALALAPDEIIRLKEAGVSDALIQAMIENGSNTHDGSGVWEDGDGINYQAAPNNRSRREHYRHERWKEERALEAADSVIIDGRRPLPGK